MLLPQDEETTIIPHEQAILAVFRWVGSGGVRFQHIGPTRLGVPERAAAIHALVARRLLTPLSGGEYWLTDEGVRVLLGSSPDRA